MTPGVPQENVLVTGCAGYIGSILTEHLLDAGYRVTDMDSLAYGDHSLFHLAASPHFTFVNGDARDERVLQPLVTQADVIVPLAAITGAPRLRRKPCCRTVPMSSRFGRRPSSARLPECDST